MDDKKVIAIVAVLIAAYFINQRYFYGPRLAQWEAEQRELAEKERERLAAEAEREPGDAAPVGSVAPVRPIEGDPERQPERPVEEPRDAVAEKKVPFVTSRHEIVLSTRGATLESLTFDDIHASTYRPLSRGQEAPPKAKFTPLHPYAGAEAVRSLALVPQESQHAAAIARNWTHEPLPAGHRFRLRLPDGLVLTKTYLPAEDGEAWHFRLVVGIENEGQQALPFSYWLNGPAGMVEEDAGRSSLGQQAVVGHAHEGKPALEVVQSSELEQVEQPDRAVSGEIFYYGLATKYFAALVLPAATGAEGTPLDSPVGRAEVQGLIQAAEGRQPTDQEKADFDGLGHQAVTRGLMTVPRIEPGQKVEHTFRIYVGPRKESIFEAAPYEGLGLDKLIDYGWFESMARLLVAVLRLLERLCGNWGLAIILLTFIVRGLLLPLSIWSQKNMLRMQQLGPELNKLKEKYARKDGSMTPEAQRAFAAAQMELFRKHGVNPVGCLGPMFLQLPVFIGLWNALNSAYELRQTEFFLWISDLSVPDVLFRLPFPLPLLGTDAFSVLPILMVATYLLQQQMQPTPSDPRAAEQQRMMKFIVPVFGFMFYTMPSGLMLYFITSSLWSIAEQKAIKRKFAHEAEEGKKP